MSSKKSMKIDTINGQKTYIIPIWVSRSKNKGFHFIEKGERLKIEVFRGLDLHKTKIQITRQFFHYPSWEDASTIRFSIHQGVIRELADILKDLDGCHDS